MQVYSDNEDYDKLNQSRDKRETGSDKNSNVYGRVVSTDAVYSQVDKDRHKGNTTSPTEEYEGQDVSSANAYDHTSRTSNAKIINDNVYE